MEKIRETESTDRRHGSGRPNQALTEEIVTRLVLSQEEWKTSYKHIVQYVRFRYPERQV